MEPEAFQYVREKFTPPSDPVFELVPPAFAQCAGQVYEEIGSPQLNPANIWEVYREMVQMLHDITSANGTNANQDCIDAVDEWQVTDTLQDLNQEPDVPYPLIEGRELLGGIEQDDGSLYLGGVNEGRGLGMWKLTYRSPLSIYFKCLSSDAGLEGKLDEMDELDEFEPDEVHGALVFSEDEEEDMIDSNDKDDW